MCAALRYAKGILGFRKVRTTRATLLQSQRAARLQRTNRAAAASSAQTVAVGTSQGGSSAVMAAGLGARLRMGEPPLASCPEPAEELADGVIA